MKKFLNIIALVLLSAVLFSCQKEEESSSGESSELNACLNYYASNVMDVYYLWKAECQSDIDSWRTTDDPYEKVESVRYKDDSGNEIDKWTTLYDNYDDFISYVEVSGKTYGYEFILCYADSSRNKIYAVVTFTYEGSPAAKAGIKRGDVIVKVNGKEMTLANYVDIANNELMGGDSCALTFYDGSELSVNSVKMNCNPVNIVKIFKSGTKSIGYLHYTSFSASACDKLIEAFKYFKQNGVKDLVLDVRYNGGGVVSVEQIMASLIAPLDVVNSSKVFQKIVYNENLSELESIEKERTFLSQAAFSYDNVTYSFDLKNALCDMDNLYVIMTGNSASASEGLVCGLKPYMNVKIIGEQSYGKYCGGILLSCEDWYDAYKDDVKQKYYDYFEKYKPSEAIYVMIERYADCNGDTPCMPDGFVPDYAVEDNPFDGVPLGDASEKLLAKALQAAGFSASVKTSQTCCYNNNLEQVASYTKNILLDNTFSLK